MQWHMRRFQRRQNTPIGYNVNSGYNVNRWLSIDNRDMFSIMRSEEVKVTMALCFVPSGLC